MFRTNQDWMNFIPFERTLTSWIDFELLVFHHSSSAGDVYLMLCQICVFNTQKSIQEVDVHSRGTIFIQGGLFIWNIRPVWTIHFCKFFRTKLKFLQLWPVLRPYLALFNIKEHSWVHFIKKQRIFRILKINFYWNLSPFVSVKTFKKNLKKNLMRKSGAWILSTYCKLYVRDL
jgi:hypothetical protein